MYWRSVGNPSAAAVLSILTIFLCISAAPRGSRCVILATRFAEAHEVHREPEVAAVLLEPLHVGGRHAEGQAGTEADRVQAGEATAQLVDQREEVVAVDRHARERPARARRASAGERSDSQNLTATRR